MQKLAKTIATMTLLAPLGVGALGIGDIRLHSTLNQTMDAEIPLVLSGTDVLGEVKVGLASPEAFAKAGIERHYFLSKLRFSAQQNPDGSHTIRVSSSEVMREPFLSFLVEVNSPQGRVLREFTVLLDPPAVMPESMVAETSLPAARPPARRYERMAEIGWAGDESRGRRRMHRPPVSPQAGAPAAPPLTAATEEQLTGDVYGPVRRDETLWGIAKSIDRPPSATQEQMVVALYRANPRAFAGSINALKAGASLRIPTADFITELNPSAARAEFSRQQNGGRLAVPEESVAPGEPRVVLAGDKARGGAAATQEGGREDKGDKALEVAETIKQENDDLRSRLSLLEKNLAEMQNAIAQKDKQIATLEGQPRPAGETAPQVPQVPQVPEVKPPVVPPTVVSPPPVTPPPQPEVQPPVSEPVPAKPPEAIPAKPPETAVRPVPPPAKPPVVRPVPPPPPPEAGWLDTTTLSVAALIAGIIGLTAWYIKRRRNAMIAETESILLAAERESLQKIQSSSSKAVESMPAPLVATKSSFLSEFTPSDFDALGSDTDEVDPVSEADVYLAYGRYKQAEDLIRHAIQQYPERDECKLKLLEIYYATENQAAFEGYARELKAQKKDSHREFWAKVEEMGRDLAPSSALFLPAGSSPKPRKGSSLDTPKSLGSLDLSDDLIDDLRRFEVEFSESPAPGEGESEEDELLALAFDMETEEPPTKTAPPRQPATPEVPSLRLDKPEARVDEERTADQGLAFDFGEILAKAPQPEAPKPPPDKTIDDLLREMSLNAGAEQAPRAESTEPAGDAGQKPGKLGFTLELLEPDADRETPPSVHGGAGEPPADITTDLTDMDQLETKLDLARAYADMDDAESVRDILQEVLAKGNERQKAEAKTVMDKLGPTPLKA